MERFLLKAYLVAHTGILVDLMWLTNLRSKSLVLPKALEGRVRFGYKAGQSYRVGDCTNK